MLILHIVVPGIDCTKAMQVFTWFASFSAPVNALLFLFRVNGVYHDSKPAVAVFTFLWFTTCLSFTSPWALNGSNIGPTPYCIVSKVSKYEAVAFITISLFDTVVLLAITYRLLSISLVSTWGSRWKAFIKGQGMGKVSKMLLHTGQCYYSSEFLVV